MKKLSNKTLTKALIGLGIPYECAKCCLGNKWNGKLIVLKIDHIDANVSNYEISNLRFLCPNCYSQSNIKLPRRKRHKIILSASEEICEIEDLRVMKILAKQANDSI